MDIKDFTLPTDSSFTDDEKKGLQALGDYIKSQLQSVADGIKSMPDIVASVKAELATLGLSSEKMQSIEKSLKEQGVSLTMLQKRESGNQRQSIDEQIKEFITAESTIKSLNEGRRVSRDIKVKAAAAMLTSTNAQGVAEVVNVEVDRTIHATPASETTVMNRLMKEATSSPVITWINRTDGEGGSAFIAEGALKPLKDWDYTTETSKAKKVAVSTKVSTEMLQDFAFMRGEINTLLSQDLREKVNHDILLGTGVAEQLKGIATDAAGYTTTELNGKVAMPNYADAIRAAILQIRSLNFKPDVVFINPTDRALIDLTKDNTGHYISSELFSVMREVQIVETSDIDAGKFLVMDSARWEVRPYEQLRLEYGWVDDDFQKNMVTVIAEMRLHSYQPDVYAGAIVYDDFATVLAAIEKTA